MSPPPPIATSMGWYLEKKKYLFFIKNKKPTKTPYTVLIVLTLLKTRTDLQNQVIIKITSNFCFWYSTPILNLSCWQQLTYYFETVIYIFFHLKIRNTWKFYWWGLKKKECLSLCNLTHFYHGWTICNHGAKRIFKTCNTQI